MKNKVRLGVNIDHVATLRQARGESYPSIADAARLSLEAGSDQITIHLREDRRHIQDTDLPVVKLVTERYGKPLNLELGVAEEIIQIAIDCKPDWICIVPEKREERTTEGGLNVTDPKNFEKVLAACEKFKEKIPNVKISLFVEAELATLEACIKMPIDAVEIHTGDYAKAYLQDEDISIYLQKFQVAKELIESHGLGYHAGHGLTDESLVPLVENKLFAEYNIGHWIISDSIFCGLERSIQKLTDIIKKFEG